MYNKVKDNVFDGILTAVFNEFIAEEMRLLPTDDELSVMYPTSEKQLKQYRKKAKQMQKKAPTLSVYLKRIAIIALAVISAAFGVLMTNEGVRAAIVESFITWYDKYVEFDFSRYEEPEKEEEGETDPLAAIDALVIGYIPKGFELTSSDEKSGHREYMYTSDNGDYITIGIYDSKYSDIGVDSENTEYEVISVNGREAHLMYDENDRCGVLLFGNSEYYVSIMALTDKSELIKIAENITVEQPQADTEAKTVDDFVIGYIPEGFSLVSSDTNDNIREDMYSAESGEYIIIKISLSDFTEVSSDAEDTAFEQLKINNNDAYLIYANDTLTGNLTMVNNGYTVWIAALIAKDELIKIAENITAEQPQADAEESTKTFKDLEIGYIPENFDLTSETEDDYKHEYIYMADNGDYLMVGAYDSESSEHSLDTENSEYEVISVNGYDAYVTYNSDERTGSVIMGNDRYNICITALCTKDELIKIAENIK